MRSDTELLDALEAMTKKGACSAVLLDHTGHYAMVDEYMRMLMISGVRNEVKEALFLAAANWKDTVREAINSFIDENLL